MKAILFDGPSSSLIEADVPEPIVNDHDLLVEVKAVSVNPVDVKLRASLSGKPGTTILGFDAAGIVKEVGCLATGFVPGDRVYYAGDWTRPGSNAQLQSVDARIVGKAPNDVSFQDAASLPLTSLTAWELLFETLLVDPRDNDSSCILIIGGAGGVASILTQIARRLTGLTVICTASRPESRNWVRKAGAHEVVDHSKPLDEELARIGMIPRFVAALNQTPMHFDAIAKSIAPRGRIAVTDELGSADLKALKTKSVSVSWEFMFTRSMYSTGDMFRQGAILNRVSDLLSQGSLKPTASKSFANLSASSLQEAHDVILSGSSIGKTVLGPVC